MTPILHIDNISKSYQTFQQDPTFWGSLKNFVYRKHKEVHALQPISFSVQKGEFIGVLGPNGAGKTTTLKILTGLITPTTGKATAFGQYDTSARTYAYLKRIGMVMGQRQQLQSDLPALDSFYLAKALYDIDDAVFNERLDEFKSMLSVEEKIRVPVRKLSLGERMKMELILSLLHHPEILFLDEPTIGLDFQAAQIIRKFLRRMNRELQMTILLTSHYSKDIEELCERVILINHGRMVYDGPLAGVDERIHGQRVIDLRFRSFQEREVFRTASLPAMQSLKSMTEAKAEDMNILRLIIASKDSQDVLSMLMQGIGPNTLADLSVGEQPLDEIFTQIYSNTARL